MMKKLWIGLVLVLLLALLCCGAAVADGSGSCGNTVTWVLSGNTLTISGTGVMADYNNEFDSAPWFDQKEDITTVVINNGVSSIGDCAFLNCTGLTSVTIPGSVTSIGFSAFEGCSALNVVEIPNGVTEIASYAFYGCSGLTGVKIPESVTNIAYRAFASCPALKIAVIRNRETVIGDSSHDVFQDSDSSFILYGWTGSTAETYATDTGIGFEHLDNCSGQCGDEVYWEFDPVASRMEITGSGPMWNYHYSGEGTSPFIGNEFIVSVVIGSGVTSIGDAAFFKCINMTSITISNSVTSIGLGTFNYCTSLTSITIPNSVMSIGDYAFYMCTNLTGVTIPDSVTSIGAEAFCGCTNLTGITIPNSVTSIGKGAFLSCTNLKSATVRNPYTTIGDSNYNVFYNTASGFTLHGYSGSTAETYAAAAGHTFKAITAEMATPSFTFPASLTAIEDEAFYGCHMTVVYIPDTVTSLGSRAFANCTSLLQIRIPAGITVIPADVFQGINKLQFIIFGTPGSAAETFANENGIRFEVD